MQKISQLEKAIVQARAAKQSLADSRIDTHTSFLRSPECEKHLRHFIDSNIVAVKRSNINGDIYEANDACVRLLGYDKEELVSGKIKWTDITPPEYRELEEIAIAQIKATGRATPWEKVLIRKDKKHVPVLIIVTGSDTTGEDCLVFLIDMTDKKNAEARLKASEAQFRLLAEAIPQIVWISDRDGKTHYCNQRFYDLTGLKREEENGFLWLRAIHPDDRQMFIQEARNSERLDLPFEVKGRFRMRSGKYHWSLFRAIPMHDPITKESRWFGTCTDIDDQIKTEELIRKSEAKFRTLADAIPQIVWTANGCGEIDFFNQRWFEYTGLTLEQSLNNGWQLLIHPDDLSRYMSEWRKALMTGDSHEIEFRLKRAVGVGKSKGNSYRWHLGRAVALRGREGHVVKWFATWTEIESQKRS